MYLVKCKNLRRSWSRGDLTSINVVYDVKIFKKRETAKAFIEKQSHNDSFHIKTIT